MQYTLKQQSEIREQRARAILQTTSPETIDQNTYLVPSQTNPNKKYRVTHLDGYTCECKDFQQKCQQSGMYCKHIKAIILFQKLKDNCKTAMPTQEINVIIDNPACPHCKSTSIFKRGTRNTQMGSKQIYCCKDCHKRFVLEPIKRIKGNAKIVCLAMDSYYKGLSYRDIADQFQQFFGFKISHNTIRNWILQFTKAINTYSKSIKPTTGNTWNADETLTKTKKGNDHEYVWNVMNNKTRFLLASKTSERKRGTNEAYEVMKEAKEQAGIKPEQIITDRLPSYQKGINKAFKNWGQGRKRVKHISIIGKRKIINNNAIENLHTHQKEFHKVRRGVGKVQDYADGFKAYHNYIRKAVKDKKTPAERAGIQTKHNNRWYPLLVNAVKK